MMRPIMNPMDIEQFEKLKVSGNLPSPRGVALAIMRLSQKEDASMAELVRVIKPDPAFVGRLVKAANSVNANPGRPVVSVQEALVVLGMPAVRNLALSFSLLSQYRQGACKGFDYTQYWSESLACGIAFQELTLRTRVAQPEEAFSVGLLSRIGELALATMYAEEYAALLRTLAKNPAADLVGLEIERFAMSHRELSAAMLRDWGLPKIYCSSVQVHERCDDDLHACGSREYVLLQSLALSRQIGGICVASDDRRAAGMARLFELGLRLDFDQEALTALCNMVVREWQEWSSMLSVAPPPMPSFEQLAERAAGQAEALAARGAQPKPLRILVVAAQAAVRAELRAVLADLKYSVFEASNSESALAQALEKEPHMLVLGRLAQPTEGFALTRALRATRLGRSMYVLMLDKPGEIDAVIEGYESGIDDFLMAGPLDARLLAARLGNGRRIVHLHQELEHDREELRRFAADLAVSNRRFEELALTDVLTGFPNRRYAMDFIGREWAGARRSGRPLSCMVIDLDQFKKINDTHGHDVGDAYLKQMAAAIRGALRAQDVVCRTGGDEFLVICPATGLRDALACAERVRLAVEHSTVSVGSLRLHGCLCVGVAVSEAGMPHADALIKRADEGVYLAKQRGRNCVATVQSLPVTP